jgi:hypothetical protein
VHVGITIAALCLAAAGVMFLFAPQETGSALLPGAAGADKLIQLLGAALLGFAMMNWTAKGAALGGIYGRAVVIGNFMHMLGGAFILVPRALSDEGTTTALLILTGMYAAGAALFVYLTFFSSGLGKRA